MNRLLILAALLLSVVGGLALMSSSSPVAAQTDPSATRSFEPATVQPGGTVTVSIAIEGVALAGSVTETLPAGFTYVSTTNGLGGTQTGSEVEFRFLGSSDFTYTVTASMTEDSHSFSGTLNPGPGIDAVDVVGATDVTVATIPPQTGPEVTSNNLEFDVVPSKAVKGATVSGVGNPISSNPLKWVVDNSESMTLGDFDGSVGDFVVEETANGDEFVLKVATSNAPTLMANGSQDINVDLTYTNADGEELTSTLMGTVTRRDALDVADSFTFKVPQNVAEETPIGSFNVSGRIGDEPLDGIISGDDASPFAVNDDDMTIYRKNGVDLVVDDYTFFLTVNGDAGLAARADRATVTIEVTASNEGHTAPATFVKTISENDPETGQLVKRDTVVGDASEGVSNPDSDTLTYSDDSPLFDVDPEDGAVTVGSGGLSDSEAGPHQFQITVSDGVSANDKTIEATVTVDVNERVTAKADGLPDRVMSDSSGNYTFASEELAGTLSNPVKLFSFADLVSGADDYGDVPDYKVVSITSLAPLALDTENGNLNVTHIPEAIKGTLRGEYTVTVGVNDGYNRSDNGGDGASNVPPVYDDDATITVTVTINVQPAPNRLFPNVTVAVDEETPATGDMEILGAIAGLDTNNEMYSGLAALVENIGSDAMTYTHISGMNKGADVSDNEYFSVNSDTGAVTMTKSISYEDIVTVSGDVQNPSLTIEVKRNSDAADLGFITLTVKINDVNEAPVFASDTASAWVLENAVVDSAVKVGDMNGADFTPMATDEDDDSLTYEVDNALFGIVGGKLVVKKKLDADSGVTSHTVVITASDGSLTDTQTVTITVGDANDDPEFVDPDSAAAIVPIDRSVKAINENATVKVVDFKVVDTDGANNTLSFSLDDGVSQNLFEIKYEERSATDATVWTGELWTKAGLDYEGSGAFPYNPTTGYTVLVLVNDGNQGDDTLTVHVTLNDLNDNKPLFKMADKSPHVSVNENTARGAVIGTYVAEDGDGTSPNNTITYSIKGDDADSFYIDSATGVLKTLASLDFDSESGQNTPCNGNACEVTIVATDGGTPSMSSNLDSNVTGSGHIDLTINLVDAADSVSGFSISKANPIADISSDGDDAMTALADAKTTMSSMVPESPADLPATMGDAPRNFVSADWGNWGTVLRIEVTSESPDPDCGNGNQCVFLGLDADSSDDKLRLEAYRSSTQENLFIAAVMLIEDDDDRTTTAAGGGSPVYMHTDGSVARILVDEEDDIEIRLIEKDSDNGYVDRKVAPIRVEVENEAPEFNNFMPEHEAAFDDGDVEYTFTVTDSVSGIPEPEDLPDTNGDSDYMPLVALVSGGQCALEKPEGKDHEQHNFAGNIVWCEKANPPQLWPITDDRDFDEIDDGFEVDTKIVLDENRHHYVTFVACDAAGNCALYTPDSNEVEEAFAKITVDTDDPVLFEARTGIMWDATDEELDKNNPTWIQVIFKDLSVIDEDSVEADDFVVKGHTVKDAKRYGDDADGDAARLDSDAGSDPGNENTWRSIFLELEDELAPDEEPNVSLVPNGIMDKAGNEQDDGDKDAKDYIAPSFTVVSIVSPRTPDAGMDSQLAGEDDEVVITLTSDERIQETRPKVTITHVKAPAGKVFTDVERAKCDDEGTDDGYRMRGEIVNSEDCQDSAAAKGSELGKTIAKVSNTEWTITVKEPDATGYYNIYIEGTDRSDQDNKGDEGIAPDKLVTDFFERDGDVNADDAHFFQGDRNLANPAVWVSGKRIEDTEPAVEFKTPLFVELNFTTPYLRDCGGEEPGSDDHKAKCFAESDEYAKDSFDSVTVTSFTLNGTDITDMVKTTDDETFLVSIEGIELGDHEIEIQAVDQAGNDLAKTLSVEFEVEERDDFSQRLNPGWNLVSIPGEPADSDISVVFGSDMQVRTVYTYNPIIPGGWMVAVRESADAEWQGDLKEITARQGYWVLSDAIQDWDVSIPRLAGGAVGSGTPIQPPVIALYAGWNLVPVIDVTGDFAGSGISAQTYLQSLDDGLDLARVLGFNTITNTWSTVMAPESGDSETLEYGKAYWVFVRQAASLVPGN